MSLKEFHVVFITASILLSLGCAYWAAVQYNQFHGKIYMGACLLSVIAAIGLGMYEVYFIQKTRASDDR